jgi:hypothetical protein
MLAGVSIAVVVCVRASAFTSATSFGLPPGLPLWPFLKGFEIVVVHLIVPSLLAVRAR